MDNPFAGTPELNGLKVMMGLSDWDVKDARSSDGPNTAILIADTDAGGPELRYLVTDWGATMGKWGNIVSRTGGTASGAAAHEGDCFTRSVRSRIEQCVRSVRRGANDRAQCLLRLTILGSVLRLPAWCWPAILLRIPSTLAKRYQPGGEYCAASTCE